MVASGVDSESFVDIISREDGSLSEIEEALVREGNLDLLRRPKDVLRRGRTLRWLEK